MTYDHSIALTRFEALGKLIEQLGKLIDDEPIQDMKTWKNRFEHTVGLANAFAEEFEKYKKYCENKQPYLKVIKLINVIDDEVVRIGELLKRAAEKIPGTPISDALGVRPTQKYIN